MAVHRRFARNLRQPQEHSQQASLFFSIKCEKNRLAFLYTSVRRYMACGIADINEGFARKSD